MLQNSETTTNGTTNTSREIIQNSVFYIDDSDGDTTNPGFVFTQTSITYENILVNFINKSITASHGGRLLNQEARDNRNMKIETIFGIG